MRPYGTSEQLQVRRDQAINLLKQGKTVAEVAAQLKVTERTVYRWKYEQKYGKPKSERPPGKPAYLSKEQLQQLEKELLKGAYAHGYSEDYWTLDRIGHLIWDLFQVRYTPSGVWRLLQKMGWSCQKVQRLAIQRNDEKIRRWKRWVWPKIKKKWRLLKAILLLIDEAGFCLISPLKRTWAPRGQTPTVRTSLDHRQRLNLLAALLVSPQLRKIRLSVRSFRCALNSDHVILFLQQVLWLAPGHIILLWDRHRMHLSSATQAFIENHPHIHQYHFPTCAPELNPVEFVWTQLNEYTAGFAPHNMDELWDRVQAGIARTRVSKKRLRACLKAADLSWK
ncbi:MAG: IS630 family transposase [Anaerolineales bacterium]|nr:MAG: IS630 family transposase [Anaerolineales bacterium]